MCATVSGTNHERRAATRAALEARATVHLANQEFTCFTRDVSHEGLALTGHDSMPPPGTFMRVHLKLPKEHDMLDLDGILVRTDPQNSGVVWGLKLIEGQTEAHRRIRSYVDEHSVASRVSIFPRKQETKPGAGFTSIEGATSGTLAMPPGPSAQTRLGPTSSSDSRSQPQLRKPTQDNQFFQLYEDALAQASHRQPSKLARVEPRASDRSVPEVRKRRTASLLERSRLDKASGGTTDLDVELHWLYEEAARKTANTSHKTEEHERGGLFSQRRKSSR